MNACRRIQNHYAELVMRTPSRGGVDMDMELDMYMCRHIYVHLVLAHASLGVLVVDPAKFVCAGREADLNIFERPLVRPQKLHLAVVHIEAQAYGVQVRRWVP